MNFNDPMPYSFYDGVRDLSPQHVMAILQWQEYQRNPEADAHIITWEEHCIREEELDAADAIEAQWEEEYRNQSGDYLRPYYDDKDYR